MVVALAEGPLKTRFGEFREILFYDGQKESIALIMGDIQQSDAVLCRIHSSCIFGHVFNSIECDCREQMEKSQRAIQEEGKGLVIWLDQEGKGNGHMALLHSQQFKRAGMKQSDAYVAAGYERDARNYRVAAKILQHLGIASVRLLTDNAGKAEMLREMGIEVAGIVSTT